MVEVSSDEPLKNTDWYQKPLGCIGGIALFLVVALLTRALGLGWGGLFVFLGVICLISALLLKMGISKPGGWFFAGETPLGQFLIGIGFSAFGIDTMFSGEDYTPSDYVFPTPVRIVLLAVALSSIVGFFVERRARKRREANT